MSCPIEIDTIESSKSLKRRRSKEKISFGKFWGLKLQMLKQQKEEKKDIAILASNKSKLDDIEYEHPILKEIYSRAGLGHETCFLNINLNEYQLYQRYECSKPDRIRIMLQELGFDCFDQGNYLKVWWGSDKVPRNETFRCNKTEKGAAARNKVIQLMAECDKISWSDIVKNFKCYTSSLSATPNTIEIQKHEVPDVLKCNFNKLCSFDFKRTFRWNISRDFIKALQDENIHVKLETSHTMSYRLDEETHLHYLVFSPSTSSW